MGGLNADVWRCIDSGMDLDRAFDTSTGYGEILRIMELGDPDSGYRSQSAFDSHHTTDNTRHVFRSATIPNTGDLISVSH